MKRSLTKFLVRLDAAGRRDAIEARARKLHVTLEDLYEGDRVPSTMSARRDVYRWLMSDGMGLNEVARLFDRAPSGVLKLTKARIK